VKMGHKVCYLVRKGSECGFAEILHIDPARPLETQVPENADVAHFHNIPLRAKPTKPYIVTMHGNGFVGDPADLNTVFVSRDHAARYGSTEYIYNGMDWDDYGAPDLEGRKEYCHFLGNAAWRVKNLKGAIRVAEAVPGERLYVLGGWRVNFKKGFRVTLSTRARFCGMVGGERKMSLLRGSKALLFPVRWHEPYGLALGESLYFGCPVLGTPYGSLPELINPEVGFLSAKADELSEALANIGQFSRKRCHEYARDCLNSKIMTLAYLEKFRTVMDGKTLNAKPPTQFQQEEKFLPFY